MMKKRLIPAVAAGLIYIAGMNGMLFADGGGRTAAASPPDEIQQRRSGR